MPVDFRYHLASLVAVFCALLIGILLGIALVGDPSLPSQLRAFKQQRSDMQRRIEKLEKSGDNSRAFGKQILPYLTERRLRGTRVAVLLNRDLSDTPWVESVITTIGQAGAQVLSNTSILPSFLELDREDAAKVLEESDLPVPVVGDLRGIVAGKMVVRIAEGRADLPYRLRQLGLIGVAGDYSQAAHVVLLVGGTDSDFSSVNAIDLPMIRALQEAGQRVVACESSEARVSAMHHYQRRAISTVDNADTAAGHLALVLVLAGADGDFGVKSTADQLLPELTPSWR
ncbi:MAG: copper transporter [Armatimonadota bacterium]|nr:MAG: copper transporter [Armatimonadota bacterium]